MARPSPDVRTVLEGAVRYVEIQPNEVPVRRYLWRSESSESLRTALVEYREKGRDILSDVIRELEGELVLRNIEIKDGTRCAVCEARSPMCSCPSQPTCHCGSYTHTDSHHAWADKAFRNLR